MADPPTVEGKQAPEIEGRRRVYQAVAAAPGIHVREVVRRSKLAYGSVEYHLRRLEEAGLIEGRPEGQLRVFFAKEFPKGERDLASAARSAPARRILTALLSLGEVTHGDLAQATQLKPSNVTYHLRALTGRQLVVARREGRALFLSLKDPALVERVLVRHGPSFADPALDAFLDVWGRWQAPPAKEPPGGKGAAGTGVHDSTE
jgi:predicted transcriptional regulator